MRGMAGFDPKYPGTYYIARASVTPPTDLLTSFWDPLDKWLQHSCQDIATIQFLKLLAYLRIVFLQDSVLLRQKYPQHPLWNHRLFSLPAYDVFAKDVLAHLDHEEMDQNSLIRTALPHLGQQVVDLHTGLTNLMTAGFLKQKELFRQVEDKLDDFLTGKVTFTLTPTKIRPRPQGTSPIPLNMLDPILHPPMADVPAFSSTATDNPLSPFGSPDLAALTPVLDGQSASSVRSASVGTAAPPSYLLNRQVSSVIDLWREWNVGLGTGPAVGKLNSTYGSGWRRGWPAKERQYYSQRLTIIEYLTRRTGTGSREDMAKQIDNERGILQLNGLANEIKKGKRG